MSLIASELIGGEQPFDDPAEQKSLLDKVIGAVKEVFDAQAGSLSLLDRID